MKRWKSISLWLFVIILGIANGAGLYEARVVVPQWFGMSPKTWSNTGILFWAFVTTGPLTILTFINLFAAWRDHSSRRTWWLAATAIILLERITTFAYFIPTIIRLQSSVLSQADVDAGLEQWVLFNYGRHLLSFAGWLLALKVLSMSDTKNEQR